MRLRASVLCAVVLLISQLWAQAPASYLGFDRNNYPGDQNLKALHKTFSFAGYWLNRPPSARTNTWAGKRAKLQAAGFGFLVLFNGRLYADLKTVSHATALGKSDARAAALAANREGFPGDTIIFLDQEQGGRMLPEQKAYIYAWVDGVTAAGFRAGIYCSGIAAEEDRRHHYRYCERHSPECGRAQDCLLCGERRLSARAGVRISPQAAQPDRKRHQFCRGLAVCPIAAAE